ncbi:MAG: chromosome segregation SMC family protein, partial [Candidatus Latescibacterota bacterium]
MKLSRLEVVGFKTFARKLDVRLLGGITSIVGPNGCGKSNVVDAIRWVLGEQKPSQIRLERMEDVIFKGTPTRKQLGMAEVSLTIDNESGRLPLNMPEVTITRRLFRSGESEYLLNRKICRLADINELFMDTGMGTDSYSVFELGMINSILSDKTEDRRLIFEEAAGVTKYKARRRTAINRMLSIDDDLNRVGDIIAELDRRVESLKRQAQKASRYRSLRSEVKARTVSVAAHEIAKLRGKVETAEEELNAVLAQAENLRGRIAALNEEYDAASIEILGSERELGEIASRFNTLRNDITEREKELARLDSRIEYLQQSTVKLRESARQNSFSLDRIAEQHGRTSGEWDTVSARLGAVEQAAREMRVKYTDFETRVAERDSTYRSIENEYRRLEKEIASCRAMIVTVRVRREGGDARLGDIDRRVAELEPVIRNAGDELARLREERLRNTGREHELTNEISGAKSALAERIKEMEGVDSDLRKAGESHASLRAERDFLAEVIRTYAGYSEGVRNAVGAADLKGRVLTVLADCVSADDRYVHAVEAALADSLQSIVVDSPEAALDGARYLANDTRGRAVFLPVSGRDSGHPVPAFAGEGVIGPAGDFV